MMDTSIALFLLASSKSRNRKRAHVLINGDLKHPYSIFDDFRSVCINTK